MKSRRKYDEEFKKMAVELSVAQGSLKKTAIELGITPQILTRWRRERVGTQSSNTGGKAQLDQDQQEIRRLKKELKQAELDRIAKATRYTKKGGRHLLQERPHRRTGEIFRFIKAHQTEFPVEMMGRVLNVSRTGPPFRFVGW